MFYNLAQAKIINSYNLEDLPVCEHGCVGQGVLRSADTK